MAFKHAAMQKLYDGCLAAYEAGKFPHRGSGGTAAAFWNGYDGHPARYVRGSLAYAAWAAGRDARRYDSRRIRENPRRRSEAMAREPTVVCEHCNGSGRMHKSAKKKEIATVGIDAGMLYLGDPCYVIDKPLGAKPWGEFLDDTYKSRPDGVNALWWSVEGTLPNPAYKFTAGHVVTTGWGDGEYPVHITLSKEGRVASVTVTFIQEGE